MKKIEFSQVNITDGFWKSKQDMVKSSTVYAVYNQFKDNRFAALECKWKEGDENRPHYFWDSDVAKWIEGAAYLIKMQPDANLEEICDTAIDNIVKNSDENGYFNSYFLTATDETRFSDRDRHELYCLGHLIEAGVAYYDATGKDKLLKAVCKFTDYVEKVFKIENSAAFATPGHPELELALYKLYKSTGEKRYLELAKHFIDLHGNNDKDGNELYRHANKNYNQDEMPLRERSTADGHSVRALYLLCGMADIADEYGDTALLDACKRCFDNIVTKRMYITGGVGSTPFGEAFTVDYDLPNRTAYAETCASIAMVLFCDRMCRITGEAKYADALEKAMYNGVLSGVSMDGRSFFYVNPLEIDLKLNNSNQAALSTAPGHPITQRLEVFGCSCCPPNMVRFIPSIGGYAFSEDDDTLYILQYMNCELSLPSAQLKIATQYPANGKIKISGMCRKKRIAIRIPSWCKSFTLNCDYTLQNGYAHFDVCGNVDIELNLDMPIRFVFSNRAVHENAGRVALLRGPIVYCAEGIDNGEDLKSVSVDTCGKFDLGETEFLLPNIYTKAYLPKKSEELYSDISEELDEIPLKLIPYYAFANRGSSDMVVWLLKK